MRLMQERENLIADLEECKTELFKRMPPTQISDDTIQKAFERICRSIDGFVFDTTGDVVDDALYNLCQKKRLSQKQKRRKSRNPLSEFIKKADISAWGPYDCSNCYILSVIIQWILDTYVFGKSYPMGITEQQIRILKEVEKGMCHASQAQSQLGEHILLGQLPNREIAGQERIDMWRSETLTALTALRENETRLEEASRKICWDLDRYLSPYLLEAGPFARVEGRFRREILDPAIKLHQDLRSSSHQYYTTRIKVFDRLSPKQMLDEWDLKDADLWQRTRGEKEVGKALYCLHPSIIRLRTKGQPPIVITKPVIVVTSAERERISYPQGNRNSSLSGTIVPPASIESSPATSQIMSSLDQESFAHVKFADNLSVSTDSDSTSTSRSRQHDFSQRRASIHPTTQKQEYLPASPRRRLSVPLESSDGNPDLPRDSRSYLEEERQSSGKAQEDQDIRPYRRGHFIAGTSNSFSSQAAARQPSRRGSRDGSGDKSSPRRSASEAPQPPIAPSNPVASTPSDKSRRWRYPFFPQ